MDNRKKKIQALRCLMTGRVSIGDLRPPRVYIFIQSDDKPGIYEHDGVEYSKEEYESFCAKISKKKSSSIMWNEGRTREDTIITFVSYKKQDIGKHEPHN